MTMGARNRAKVAARKASRELVIDVYNATKHFDQLQQLKYGNEIRKLATSMSSYISDATSRSDHEKLNEGLLIGYETMIELLTKLVEARDLNILPVKFYVVLKYKIDELSHKINQVVKAEDH